ncbi:uncharacterized protein LOC105843385 isoform X1 [Hydra vulgaris]|uniref:uncharacterized protein LOC105843385 isoform X1 n=1 Tax=Hydra vulgaris TaxID=6087 RepID=UPI000641664B|nr:uncharacterized protein LOC105843385 [Hydra vulgaris]
MSMSLACCLILAITLYSNPVKANDGVSTWHQQSIYKYGGKVNTRAQQLLNVNIGQSLKSIDNVSSPDYTFFNKKTNNKKQHELVKTTKLAQRNQGLLVDTGKLRLKKKKKAKYEKVESVDRAKKQTQCYKSFSWCQHHSKKILRKIECEKELKQCILTACKKANKCNPSFDECYQRNTDNVKGKYRCYTKWKRCAERYCSIKL